MSATPMHSLVYCPARDDTIADLMGRADYSYYFVLKRFRPLLSELGDVTDVIDLGGLTEICQRVRADGAEPVLWLFAPPHDTPPDAPCPVIPVFAWEFNTIPDEEFGGHAGSNWAQVLAERPGAITHSQYAVGAALASISNDVPIVAMPAPVWDTFASIADVRWDGRARTLRLHGTVLDSWELGLTEEPVFDEPHFATDDSEVTLSGVVFTTLFNPQDKRKNWYDLINGFVWAFRDRPEVTLVIKIVHFERDQTCWMLLQEMRKLAPYQCRIVVIQGFLEQDSFDQLVASTTFVVNSAHAEGQCLPLMEFMSAGKPAVAPDHTSMADYITEENSFVVASSPEWAAWPQDPRQVFRCVRYRIDWQSMVTAYAEAFDVATKHPDRYEAMSRAAQETLREHCSLEVTRNRLNDFIKRAGLPPAQATHNRSE